MTDKTHAAYGDKTNMMQQSVGLFAKSLRRKSTLNNLVGPMPKGEGSAEATIKKQTSKHVFKTWVKAWVMKLPTT